MTFAPITTEFTVPTYIFCSLTPKDIQSFMHEYNWPVIQKVK